MPGTLPNTLVSEKAFMEIQEILHFGGRKYACDCQACMDMLLDWEERRDLWQRRGAYV